MGSKGVIRHMSVIARRAGEELNSDQLKAHISLLLRVENVGVLLGSGASISAGGQQMKEVLTTFQTQYTDDHNFLISKDLLTDDSGVTVNFEELLAKISLAISFYSEIEPNPEECNKYKAAITSLQRCVLKAAKLEDAFWGGAFDDVSNGKSLKDYQTFLIRLCASRQPGQPVPWIFTLNYDLGIEWAAESLGININNGFKGLHNRKFESAQFDIGFRNSLSSGQAQFSVHGINCVKMHGSLSWRMTDESLTEVPSTDAKAT